MKKLLAFDAWTKGISHFERLRPACEAHGVEMVLVHVGSWGYEPGRPKKELIGGISVRDISFYRGAGMHEILALERPDVVLFFSTDAFVYRAFIRYCRETGIPTLHLFHGIQRVLDLGGGGPFKANMWWRIWLLRSYVWAGLVHFWPTYAKSLWDTRADAVEWRRFAQDLLGRARGRAGYTTSIAAADSKANRVCVYIESEIAYAMNKYGYTREEVTAVGNPDLVSFGLTESMLASGLEVPAASSDVIYIDTALLQYGSVFKSEAEYVAHIVATRLALCGQGKNLVYKAHPRQSSAVLSALRDAQVELCPADRFLARLRDCCAVIAEPSTAAIIPALMGLPLFLAQYGSFCGQTYGDLLTTYPRAQVLTDLAGFSRLLSIIQADSDGRATRHWINENTGPLPAEAMPERVLEKILLLCERGTPRPSVLLSAG